MGTTVDHGNSMEVLTDETRGVGRTNSQPSVSLIVCSRDRPALLFDTVSSILEGNLVPNELIIIDQSKVENGALAHFQTDRSCAIRYMWVSSAGLSRANNEGIRAAQHEILVFTHDDVAVTPDWLGTLVAALVQAGERTIVTGMILPATPEGADGIVPTLQVDPVAATYKGRIGKNVLYVLNMALYRSSIVQIGMFDERLGPGTPYPGGEDSDLGFRFLEAGYHIQYVPEAVLYHRAWRKASEHLQLRWSYGRGQGAFYGKHVSLQDGYMLNRMVKEIVRRSYESLCHLRHNRPVAYDNAVSVLAVCSGVIQWFMTHRKRS
ncbi:MAG: glycosyltransferase [Ktedonobacteraceae bacterium]|nr:glycosyltransferase [Ktedonobacteraceae bacterium]